MCIVRILSLSRFWSPVFFHQDFGHPRSAVRIIRGHSLRVFEFWVEKNEKCPVLWTFFFSTVLLVLVIFLRISLFQFLFLLCLIIVEHYFFWKAFNRRSFTMQCEILKGKFGGDLIYVPCEKMLYVFEARRKNGIKIFVCYQTVLTKTGEANHIKCSSRIRLLQNGTCERMNIYMPHTNHTDHELVVSDKKHMDNMKEQCKYLQENHPEDAHKISNRHIFQREIAK